MKFHSLNLPEYPFRLKKKVDKIYVTCLVRNKEILLTPEEWVRQHFIAYLINEKGYPKNLLAVEKQLKVNELTKRFDILAYNIDGTPQVLVECKAPTIPLSQSVFSQAATYNMTLKVPYLIITNGLNHIQASVDFAKNKAEIDDKISRYLHLNPKK